jgi:hypothetical protein
VTDDEMGLPGKITPAHLKEFPDDSIRLATVEAEADKQWSQKRE